MKLQILKPSFSSVLPEVKGTLQMQREILSHDQPHSSCFPTIRYSMKNCRNREVQPVQFLPPCAQEHVSDDWFSLLVP